MKTACVDFDGTIVPWGPLMAIRDPFPGVREAMQALRAAGYYIVIHTSRLSEWWLTEAARTGRDALGHEYARESFTEYEQRMFVARVLQRAEIPFDHITADKMPADVYFDDRAIQVSPTYPLDHAIHEFLTGEAT